MGRLDSEDRKRRLLAWAIALGLVAAVAVVGAIRLWPDGRAPGGRVQDRRGEWVELAPLWRDRRLVVVFYPGQSSEASRTMLGALNARLDEIDARVIGISFDSSYRADRLHRELGLEFELYSDQTYVVIGRWGVPFVRADVTGFASFVVEPGGKISYKKIGDSALDDLVAAARP